jgi:signal transduction histidine kinase/DNA-binding response OmpR family regulator
LRFASFAAIAALSLALCHSSLASTARDAGVLQLSELGEGSGLGGRILIFEDPTASLDIEQISSPHMDAVFRPMTSDNLSLGFTNSHFWLKLTVAPDPARPDVRWYLDPGWIYYSKLVFYAPDPDAAGGFRATDRGVSAHDLTSQTRLFPLRSDAMATHYLMVGSDRMLNLSPRVETEGEAVMGNLRKGIVFGVLAGVVLAMCLYNLLVFLNLRDPAYLWYVVIHACALIFLTSKQWTPLFIGPDQSILTMTIINGAGIGWCMFTRSFLDTPRHMPRNDAALQMLAGLLLVLAVAGPFALPRTTFSLLDHVLNLGVMLYGYALSVILSFRGMRQARMICMAWSSTVAFFLFYNLSNFGVLNLGHLNMFNLGIAIEAVLMSIVLAWRIKDLREEHVSAQAATEARRTFLATMSHEIRTPMTAIMGYADLLQGLDLPAQGRQYLHNVQTSAEHLLGIVNDILDMAKIDAGKLTLEEKEFSMEAVVEEVLRIFALRAKANGNELICAIDGRVPAVLVGDPLRVRQILMNLLSNAVKFTRDGEVSVEVALDEHEVAEAGTVARLRMTVRDTGIGVSPEQQKRLFQPFSQADDSMARKFGGSGLGLNISRSLARMMHGDLSLVSELGAGAAFTATVRLGVARRQPEAPPCRAAGRTALVVGDNASSRAALAALLSEAGLTARTAGSGREAAEMVRNEPGRFDIAFVDRQIPDMDGFEAAALLRRDGLRHDAPIVLIDLMGHAEPDAAELGRAGFRTVLAKPTTRRALCAALAEAFDGTGIDAEPRADGGDPDMEVCRGRRVLVVDDNEFNLDVLETILSMAGLHVVTAPGGMAALETLAEGPAFDVVLMDVQMPGMDGHETTRRIRGNPKWANLPVLAITANAMKGDREHCLDAGMNDFLTKPVDQEAMFKAMAYWIRKSSGQESRPDDDGRA